MASTLTQELYSQNHWLADGVDTIWNFTFAGGYLDRSHVKAYTQAPGAGDITPVVVTDGMFITDFSIQITPAVTAGHTLVIYRETPKDEPLVNFLDGARITEQALDTAARQSVLIGAEVTDFFAIGTVGGIVDLAADLQTARDQAVAAIAEVDADAAAAEAARAAAVVAQGAAEGSATSASGSATLASEWATKLVDPVAGGEYSSKFHAQAAAASAGTATTQAGIATTKAGEAAASAVAASGSAGTATTQAGIATTKAGEADASAVAAAGSAGTATTQAGIATTQAGTATTQAGTATTQAGIATTQAGIATTKAGEADASAVAALASELEAESAEAAAIAAAASVKTQVMLTPFESLGALDGASSPAIAAGSSTSYRYGLVFANLGVSTGTYWSFPVPAGMTGGWKLKLIYAASASAAAADFRMLFAVEAITPTADATPVITSAFSLDSENVMLVPGETVAAWRVRVHDAGTLTYIDSALPGDIVHVRLTRDSAHGDDTSAASIYVLAVILEGV